MRSSAWSITVVAMADSTITYANAAAAALSIVDCRVIVERDEECLVELTGADDLVGWLSERGARTQAIESEAGRARVPLEIRQSRDPPLGERPLGRRSRRGTYSGTDVVSFQQRDRGGETLEEFAAGLEAALTDRQFGTLQRAYLGGYVEWPRPTTGEELAQTMGVSRPTFHEHLRTAEAKLCRAFFGDA